MRFDAHVVHSIVTCAALAGLCIGCNEQPAPVEQPPAPPAPSAEPTEPAAAAEAHAHEGHAHEEHAHEEHAHAAGDAPAGAAPETPEGASVSFAAPADGATVEGPLVDGKVKVAVQMKADGIALEPAGEAKAGSGHHHIIVGGGAIPRDQVIPNDDTHLHFGKAQTEAELALAPGKHELTLQFADGLHRSYGPDLSASIAITIAATGEAAPGEEAPTAQ